MAQITDLRSEMEQRLDQALRSWIANHPEARAEQYVVVYDDAEVVGPYETGIEATRAAFEIRPKGFPHICQVGANQYAVDRVRPSRGVTRSR